MKAVATLTLTSFVMAVGQVAGGFKVDILDSTNATVASGAADDVANPVEIDVSSLAAGNYTVNAYRVDSSGAVLSTAATTSLTIPAAPATGDTTQVPATVSVSLQ
jgi:hypothetical protein